MSSRNVSGSDEKSGELRAVVASNGTQGTQTPGSVKPADAHPGHGPGDMPGNTDSGTGTQTQAFASNDAKGGHGPA